ncbi:jg25976 [Pararge aegeria aegeria]|uniref:Jg25976 protein n=1 Tax=Pararge aegeria aegeria TaxID=348720 RepID=A0A8S4RFJ1_9NEOP|nr:jg25976 [Pararge aegeria aegeria]
MARVLNSIIVLAICICAIVAQRKPIKEALFLNTDVFNSTMEDCVWRREREPCPDPNVTLNLYTEAEPFKKEVDLFSEDWLRQSSWEPSHETILLIHGYAGGDDTLPIVVLRDAYLRRGGYNVFMMDWGQLSQPPCYVAAVHNLRPVARCVAEALGSLRRAGLRPDRLTCVGHSLGAHMCGIMANYLNFRLNRIIGRNAKNALNFSASGAYCVEDFTTPFCPSSSGLAEGDTRCCLDKQYAAAATTLRPPRTRPRPVARLRARRIKNYDQNVTLDVSNHF